MAVKITASYAGDDKVEIIHGPSGNKLVTDLPGQPQPAPGHKNGLYFYLRFL